ncbi:hypothetical protein ANN_12286 [Periplaneta americana]|uniref:Uncharacterized protein n=1 Tax=Periplaneta americana TaxID=6978 RepID=A0ABQ8TGR8_PERAM|nr:hypothetical protein ANN_12286 [Periplaneta americana]
MAGLCEGGNEPPGSLKSHAGGACCSTLSRASRPHYLQVCRSRPDPVVGRSIGATLTQSALLPGRSCLPCNMLSCLIATAGLSALAARHLRDPENCKSILHNAPSLKPEYPSGLSLSRTHSGTLLTWAWHDAESLLHAMDMELEDEDVDVESLMLAGSEFQSLGRAIVKEDEYEEVRWDGSPSSSPIRSTNMVSNGKRAGHAEKVPTENGEEDAEHHIQTQTTRKERIPNLSAEQSDGITVPNFNDDVTDAPPVSHRFHQLAEVVAVPISRHQ